MGPLVPEQLREDVRVRSRRTLAVGTRDRLIHLDSPQLAHEHTVGVPGEDHTHRRIPWVEEVPPSMRPQFCRHIGIGHTDADIDLQGTKAKIERGGLPMLFP
jgi:hypothetical protein